MDFGDLGFSSGNQYLQQQIDDALGDTVRAYNLTTQPAFNRAMVNSGSFGNSGVQQMNDYARQQLQTSLGRQANDMRSGNYWQGLGFDAQNYWNNMNFDRSVYNDGWQQNQQNFNNGLNLFGMQNNLNMQNLGLGNQIQEAPLNYYGQFANIANGIGNGFGTSTSNMTAQGSPWMGALAGAQLGSMFKPTSSATGNYGFTGQGTPDTFGWSTNGNGAYSAGGQTVNNPSAWIGPGMGGG